MRDPRPLLLVALALPFAACGGSSDSADKPSSAPSAPQSSQPVSGNGKLSVGASGSGIGDAATGTSDGVTILPSQPVPGAPNTETGVGAGASCANQEIMPSNSNLGTVKTATLCLLNGERSDAGLRPLKENAKLAKAAIAHSEDMVKGQFFDHVTPNGSDPVSRIRRSGYIPSVGVWIVGENLAWGSGSLATPKAIVAAWMKSSGHRENILRADFKEIGFGIVTGNPRSRGGAGATYTTTFGGITGAKKRFARRARAARNRR
jgi:uncharacterized protein YkwD